MTDDSNHVCGATPDTGHATAAAAVAIALLLAIDCRQPANAQAVVGSGDIVPNSVQTPNWNVGGELDVGDTALGTLSITGGATVSNVDSYVGGATTGQGTITVSGSDGGGQASTWNSTGQVNIGYDGIGAVQVDQGAAVNSGIVLIGANSGAPGALAVGTVTIAGRDGNGRASTWTTAGQVLVGDGGTGTLQINDGGVMRSGQALLGYQNIGVGNATVAGAGSLWDTIGNIYVGYGGSGDLKVLDGATVSTVGALGPTSAASIYIGFSAGSVGTVTVASGTATPSTLTATDRIDVGVDGTGTLNVGKGGRVSTGYDVHVAGGSTGTGTVNLLGDASGRGILETGSVIKDAGTAVLNLDGGILRANRAESSFLNGFATLAVSAGGAWFDTNTHDIGIGTAFSGTSSLNKLGDGTLTLTGNSAGFTGNTQIQAGALRVDGTLGGPADVWSGARLTGTGQVGPTTNRGVIAPGGPTPFGTLTIAGDYAGQGGRLEIRTQLGDDNAVTDRLVITGATSGATPVTVTNVGGVGAQTLQGIQVIRVNGNSGGQFTLANPDYMIGGQPALVAGAYGYVLQKGQADGNWYLRSSLRDVSGPAPGGGTAPGGTDPAPVGAGGMLYQAGVPVYEAYANALQSLSQIASLRQRVGNRQYDAADLGRNGIWGRVEGTGRHLDPSSSTTGVHQNINSWKAQFGVDRILAGEQGASRLVGGLTAQYGTANTRLHSVYGGGGIDTTAFGVGPTLTWYGDGGGYVDAQAHALWFDSDLNSNLAGRLAKGENAHSYAVSVEAGKRLPLSERVGVVPQVQLSYLATSFSGFTDRFGARVDSDTGKSMQGRIGVALDYAHRWQDAAGRRRQSVFYGVVNLRHEFLDGTRVQVSGVPVDSRLGRNWAGVGLGWNYAWSERYALYGEVGVDSDFSGSYAVNGTVGIRMMF